MSSSIWTRCAGATRLRSLRLAPWRVVESQHHVSTRKLVDSLEEQAILEQLIETAKPPSAAIDRYHVLIAAPFRYPPLKYGSRFGTRQETYNGGLHRFIRSLPTSCLLASVCTGSWIYAHMRLLDGLPHYLATADDCGLQLHH